MGVQQHKGGGGVDVCMRCIYILESLPVSGGGGGRGAKSSFTSHRCHHLIVVCWREKSQKVSTTSMTL